MRRWFGGDIEIGVIKKLWVRIFYKIYNILILITYIFLLKNIYKEWMRMFVKYIWPLTWVVFPIVYILSIYIDCIIFPCEWISFTFSFPLCVLVLCPARVKYFKPCIRLRNGDHCAIATQVGIIILLINVLN